MSRRPNYNKFGYEPAHIWTFAEVGAHYVTPLDTRQWICDTKFSKTLGTRGRDNPIR
jgi:hypothetical protein